MPADQTIVRVVRAGVVICVGCAAAAWWLFGARAAGGVLGGGLLIAISFHTLNSGVAALVLLAASGRADVAGDGSAGRRTAARSVAKLALRYALLGFLAYVMIARLRLHPIGVIVGATSIVAAVFIEAVRLHTKHTS